MSEENNLYIKGFDKDLKCRGFQFEIGKEYKIDLPDGYKLTTCDLCSDKVFHFCKTLEEVNHFYGCKNESNRYCVIEALSEVVEKSGKCGSNHIRIIREIVGVELKQLKGMTSGNSGLFNTGCGNLGDYNSGGWNYGDRNTGCSNSGNYNSGDSNYGNYNSGNFNTGYYNTGNFNVGGHNTGSCNSGYYNSGLFNSCNHSNGIFCTIEPKVSIFNIQTDITMSEFFASKYYNALCSSRLDLTKREDGELVEIPYKEACKNWWNNMPKYSREIVKSIPNFNIDIFCEITGIDREDV